METLAEENINPAFIRVNYSLRGWLFRRAIEIRQELARVSNNSSNHDILAFYTLNNKALLVGKAEVSFLDFIQQLQQQCSIYFYFIYRIILEF